MLAFNGLAVLALLATSAAASVIPVVDADGATVDYDHTGATATAVTAVVDGTGADDAGATAISTAITTVADGTGATLGSGPAAVAVTTVVADGTGATLGNGPAAIAVTSVVAIDADSTAAYATAATAVASAADADGTAWGTATTVVNDGTAVAVADATGAVSTRVAGATSTSVAAAPALDRPVLIRWEKADQKLCLSAQGGYLAYGVVHWSGCFSTQDNLVSPLQAFKINSADGYHPITVDIRGVDACLQADGGGNGDELSLAECIGEANQQWNVKDGVISNEQGQCVDATRDSNGDIQRKPYGWYKDAQTWECWPNSDQQSESVVLGSSTQLTLKRLISPTPLPTRGSEGFLSGLRRGLFWINVDVDHLCCL